MKELFKDGWNDRSSGIVMMIVMFVAAVVVANIGILMGANLPQLLLIVAAFLVPVAGGQVGQAIQGPAPNEKPLPESAGVVQDEHGRLEIGRVLKLAAVVVALEIALVVLLARPETGLAGVAEMCSAFIGYATVSEVTQKIGRV
jgi:hypothetical protein